MYVQAVNKKYLARITGTLAQGTSVFIVRTSFKPKWAVLSASGHVGTLGGSKICRIKKIMLKTHVLTFLKLLNNKHDKNIIKVIRLPLQTAFGVPRSDKFFSRTHEVSPVQNFV